MLVAELWWMLAYPVFLYLGYRRARPDWKRADAWILAGMCLYSSIAFAILWYFFSGLLMGPMDLYDYLYGYLNGMSRFPWLSLLGLMLLILLQYVLPAVLATLCGTRLVMRAERRMDTNVAFIVAMWGLMYMLMLWIAATWFYFRGR